MYKNTPTLADAPQATSALDPKEWRPVVLKEKQQINHNTALFRFELPDPSQVVGLPVASCLLTKAPVGNKPDGTPAFAIRPYTPVSPPDAKGYFDLIVKVGMPRGAGLCAIATQQPCCCTGVSRWGNEPIYGQVEGNFGMKDCCKSQCGTTREHHADW